MSIISLERSIVPACDVDNNKFVDILIATGSLEKIGAYKIGFMQMLENGLALADVPKGAIYNHLPGGNDIPDTGVNFMKSLKTNPNIAGVILTPLSGPETLTAWVSAAKEQNLDVYMELPNTNGEWSYLAKNALENMIHHANSLDIKGIIFQDGQFEQFWPIIGPGIKKQMRNNDFDVNEITYLQILSAGLQQVAKLAKQYTDKPLIYDHQKWIGNYPHTFLQEVRVTGITNAIMFPQLAYSLETEAVNVAKKLDINLIVGGLMTHKGFVESEGGYIMDGSIPVMYQNAARLGILDYVVPGNKPDKIREIKSLLETEGITPTFYAPGFVSQGGDLTEGAQAAGKYFHAIVGRDITKHSSIPKMRDAALALTSKI